MLYIKTLVCLFIVLASNFNLYADNVPSSKILTIQSLDQIPESQPENTLFLFDVGDTLIDTPCMLGSKAWRRYISAALEDTIDTCMHDYLSLFLAEYHPIATVEPKTADFLKGLQTKGYAVFALTGRERKFWYDMPGVETDILTANQLESLGIVLINEKAEKQFPQIVQSSEYYAGILFSNAPTKGEFMKELLSSPQNRPKKVIFVDAKLSQVESVEIAMKGLGIDFQGYYYTATEAKAKSFNPLIADIQLYHFWMSSGETVLSDEEAAAIAKKEPEKNSQYYLKELLKEIDDFQEELDQEIEEENFN